MADISVYEVGSLLNVDESPLQCGAKVLQMGDVSASVTGNTLTILPQGVGNTAAGVSFTPIVVSTDAGNLVTIGADGGAFVNCEAVQDCVGLAIAAGVGLTYNDALNAITAAVSSLAVGNTATVNLTLTAGTITAKANVSATAGNVLTSDATGLFVPSPRGTNRLLSCSGAVLGYLVD